MSPSLKQYLEYIILNILGFLFRVLPLFVSLLLGWLVAALSHYVFCFRRNKARNRIRQVLGETLTKAQVNHIAWKSWRNMCFNAVEIMRFKKLNKNKIPATDDLKSFIGSLEESLEKSQNGIVLAAIHMGNWELAGITIDLHDLPIFSVARRQKNPLTDRYLNRTRSNFNMKILLNDKNIYKEVVTQLRENTIFGILPDVRNPNASQPVTFLGADANLGSGPAVFARKCHCTLQPMVSYRVGWTKHSFKLLNPIEPNLELNKKEDHHQMMNKLMSQFTKEILANPEQYFWYNKRWVLDPV